MTGSLRETKRIATMTQIQKAAIVLFSAKGFSNTTVEEIAKLAGVGPATVYRHFETKERIIIWDEYDEGFLESVYSVIAAEGLREGLRALCAAVDEGMDKEQSNRHRARMQLVQSEPALDREAMANCIDFGNSIAAALAARSGRAGSSPEDVAVGRAVASLFYALIVDWANSDPGEQRPLRTTLQSTLAALHEELFPDDVA